MSKTRICSVFLKELDGYGFRFDLCEAVLTISCDFAHSQTSGGDGGFISGQTLTATGGSSDLDIRTQGQLLTSVNDQGQLLTSVNDQGQQEEQYDYSAPSDQFQEGQQQTRSVGCAIAGDPELING